MDRKCVVLRTDADKTLFGLFIMQISTGTQQCKLYSGMQDWKDRYDWPRWYCGRDPIGRILREYYKS